MYRPEDCLGRHGRFHDCQDGELTGREPAMEHTHITVTFTLIDQRRIDVIDQVEYEVHDRLPQ